ncbi:MAG: ribonuclease E/G [Rhodospirillales bacterium]
MPAVDEVLVSALPGDRRAAACAGGALLHLAFDDGEDVRPGDLRLGRITALAPALGAAFVDIGSDRPGLLMRADAPPGRSLAAGETVLVRVARAPSAEKGAKLDARLPPGTADAVAAAAVRAPCLVERGDDPVVALLRAAAGPSLRRVVVDDAPTLSALRAAVPAVAGILELWSGRQPLFAAEGIDEAIEAALSAQVPLPSGGRLTIEETEALVAIDVDSGATPAPSPRAAALACDLEAAAEIGRHIRLRDLAGTIVIDFVPLRRPAERERVFRALQDALEGDDRRLRIGGWTRLGLLELARERRGPSLLRRLTVPCTACAGGAAAPSALGRGRGAAAGRRGVAGARLRRSAAHRLAGGCGNARQRPR